MAKNVPMRKDKIIIYLTAISLIMAVAVFGLWPVPQAKGANAQEGTNRINPEAKGRRIIMVVIDRINWRDILATKPPFIQQLLDKGAIGVMNTRTGDTRIPGHTYVTIGAGSRVSGGTAAQAAFNVDEEVDGTRAGDIYYRRTGFKATSQSVVNIELAQLLKANENLHYNVQIGAIGKALHQAGLKTAVLGNGDNEKVPGRQVASIAMDDKGMVDYGFVDSSVVKEDKVAVTGERTDYKAILKGFRVIKNKAQFIVIETGDMSRIGESYDTVLGKVANNQKGKAIREADKFLGQLTRELDWSKDRLVIVTPTPSLKDLNNHRWLTPVIMVGYGIGPGVLTSATTKREGIVSNIDLSATVVNYLGLAQGQGIMGLPMEGVASNLTPEDLDRLSESAAFTHQARPLLVKTYVFSQIVVIILAMITIFWPKFEPKFMKSILLGLMAVPMIYLLLPLLPQYSLWVSMLYTVVLSALVVWMSIKMSRGNHLYPYIIISLLTTLVILLDACTGSNLIQKSVLGYDAMEGARYYGIGNEYMGVLIGAAIVGTTGLLQGLPQAVRVKRAIWLVALFYLVVIYILAAPNLGTNVGGTIAAVAGFGITISLLKDLKPSRNLILSIIALIFVVVLGFIAFDLNRSPEAQSHIGRTASALVKGGWQEGTKGALEIIQRKLEINLKLIRYTIWSRVFLTSMLALTILFFRPSGIMKVLQNKYKYLYIGFVGILVGSMVALIFNDSGIVAAATMMIFGSAPLISLVIREKMLKGDVAS